MADARVPDPLDFSFDIYQRYRMVSDIVKSLSTGRRITILDVGGGDDYLQKFIPEAKVFVIDQTPMAGFDRVIKGDAGALPFPDKSVDFAVCVDVIEHVPDQQRPQVVSELKRVSREGVIIASPFATEGVREAEEIADRFYRTFLGRPNPWLIEHRECGLPDLEWLVGSLRESGDHVVALPNGYLPRWSQMILAAFLSEREEGEADSYRRLCTFYNRYIYPLDNREPSYRHVVVSTRRPIPVDLPPAVDAATIDADHALALLFGLLLPLHLSLYALREQLSERDRTIVMRDQSIQDKDEVIGGLERSVKEWEQFTAQVIRDKDAVINGLVATREELRKTLSRYQSHPMIRLLWRLRW